MRRKKIDKNQKDLFNIKEYLTTAPCVPALREVVTKWRNEGYKGVTKTTKELLNFWFQNDHKLPNGMKFAYYQAQKEAIETIIYVYEIKKIRSRKSLLENYAYQTKDLRLPPYDEYARYCIKMATGSGKTKVFALAITWQYFNSVRENAEDYAKNFLIIAPNVIVFDRLKLDFEDGKIFKLDPLFPKHFDLFWDFDCYMRNENERGSSTGALYLTNIQQLYEREEQTTNREPEILSAILGEKPSDKKIEKLDFDDRISKREGLLMILNDEAHHTHNEDNEWNNVTKHFHSKKNVSVQLDFSATPRYSKGSLFAWTIYDYPLKQAILDNIVKRPIKGISKIIEARSDIASVRYAGFITAAVERWKEYSEKLIPLKKKPIIFIMMTSTSEADEVGDWLRRKYPKFFRGDKTLVIHTDRAGEVSKNDIEIARKTSREVDQNTSPVNAIVSVLMLREGWDVQNVTVVVGLRPYSAKANILPEQTIGRGLRLMFRNETSYTERVDVIGNNAFLKFVEDLEKLEDLKLETFEVGKDKLNILTIMPLDEKIQYDFNIPDIAPIFSRKKDINDEINAIDVMNFNVNPLPLESKDIKEIKTFIYEGYDILTKEKELEREYTLPPVQTAEEVIGYYARRIAEIIKLPSQFSLLAPKIKEYFEKKAFGEKVDLKNDLVIQAMSTNVASYVVIKEFQKILRDIVLEHKEPELFSKDRNISKTPPFPFSKHVFEAKKTIFNLCACDNKFEYDFAVFLDNADDVKAFAKLPLQFGFCIEYTDTTTNIRHYYPDFVLKINNGEYWLIETKGREDLDVIRKDKAAENWCVNATKLTNQKWNYMKILQKEFYNLNPIDFNHIKTAFYFTDN